MQNKSSLKKIFARNSFRSRILFLVLGAIILVGLAFGFFSINALSNLGDSTTQVGSDALRGQIEETLLQSTQNNAETHSDILQELAIESKILAAYMSELFSEPELHHNPDLEPYDETVFIGDGGQLYNSEEDISSIYAPVGVLIDDEYKKNIELSAHLNLVAPTYLEQNPSIIAIYFIHANETGEFTRYFPNIGLGLVVPPDLSTITEPFFDLAAPAKNPRGETVWIPVYDDPAGRGIIVTVSSPVYTSDNQFAGIVGIDYRVDNLSASLESNQYPGGYSFVIDESGQSILLNEQGYLDIVGSTALEAGDPIQYDLTSVEGAFEPIISEMNAGEDGIASVIVDGRELIVAYAPFSQTGWSLGSVISAESVLGVAETLEQDFEGQTNSLIYNSLLPTVITISALAIIAGSILAFQLGRPLEQLTETVKEISTGNLSARVPVESKDEVGQLGDSFNQMASEMQNLLGTLEDKVADRTKRLEATAELSGYLNSTQTQEELIDQLISQLKDRFGYSEAKVFLQGDQQIDWSASDFSQNGEANLDPSLSDSQFLVSKALKSSQIIRRTFDESNPELSKTGDKIAVPISLDAETIGVLEVTNRLDKFDEADINFFSFFANQVATAINNVRLFEEAVESKQEAEVANKAKTTFLSTISHELKTPLNAILNFADFVKAGLLGEVNDQQIEAMGHIVTGGEHLLSLIDDSLDISRIEAETIYLDLREVNLVDMVNDVAGSTRALINEKPIELSVEIPENVPTIVGDKKRIMQILTNLTSNAVKYTDEGSIKISLLHQDEMVRFSVQDTGVGIHPEDYDVIFAPFGRARHSLELESSTGLGLAVTRDLVKIQNGTIGFESQLKVGSTFYVELPIYRSIDPDKLEKELVA